jgi:hypothetical protein
MTRNPASPVWRRTLVGLAAAVAAAVAAPVQAAPFTAFFTGSSTAGDPNTHYGISAADALTARDGFGIQILEDLAFVGSVEGTLGVNQNLQSVSQVDPPDTDVASGYSIWTVNNLLDQDLQGATFLLFTHTDPYTTGDGVDVAYDDANVGLVMDADLGWFIVKTFDVTEDAYFYYPAILLDRSGPTPADGVLPHDAPSDPFDVFYVVRNEALVDSPDLSEDWQLPEFQIGMAWDPNVVPEPSTAALLSLGLVALSLHRRRS